MEILDKILGVFGGERRFEQTALCLCIVREPVMSGPIELDISRARMKAFALIRYSWF